MAAPKFVQLLTSFDKDEWPSFKKYVLSQYTENSDTYRIFKWLQDRKNELSEMDDVYILASKQFKGMTSKVFLNHLSLLYQLVERWLVNEQLSYENTTFKLLLHRNLQRRGMYHIADQLSNQLQKDLTNHKELSALWAKKEILHQEYYSFNPIKYQKGAVVLSQLLNATYDYMYHLLSVYQVELVNFGKNQKHDYRVEEEKSLQLIQLLQKSENQLFFDKMYLFIKLDKTEYLEDLKNDLTNGIWPKGSLEEVVSTLYLIRKTTELYERGSLLPTVEIITELFAFSMKQGVYAEHGKLAPVTFRNIVGQLSRYQSFAFTKDFIDEWYVQVSSAFVESTRDVSHAMNCLKHEKYSEIFYYTRMKHFADDTEKALALSLHLIACFMNRKQDYDLYATTLHNYVSYLNRHKTTFSTKFYKGLLNTVKIIKKMDHGYDVDLSLYDTIFYREWCEKMVKKKG
ncbi:MAG TPA: hypothetical protein VK169_03440 [Saprospiraceae bacterium]|nr:hypothetical protein [Saprospiraceae bacterium]